MRGKAYLVARLSEFSIPIYQAILKLGRNYQQLEAMEEDKLLSILMKHIETSISANKSK